MPTSFLLSVMGGVLLTSPDLNQGFFQRLVLRVLKKAMSL
jgi:hypothetical protein